MHCADGLQELRAFSQGSTLQTFGTIPESLCHRIKQTAVLPSSHLFQCPPCPPFCTVSCTKADLAAPCVICLALTKNMVGAPKINALRILCFCLVGSAPEKSVPCSTHLNSVHCLGHSGAREGQALTDFWTLLSVSSNSICSRMLYVFPIRSRIYYIHIYIYIYPYGSKYMILTAFQPKSMLMRSWGPNTQILGFWDQGPIGALFFPALADDPTQSASLLVER